MNSIINDFYKVDEELAKARKIQLEIDMEYETAYDTILLGEEASGLGTMALREALVRSLLRERGLYLKKAEAELETRILYTRWQTLKQIISAQISMGYEKNYG